jgi:ketosteroid isomerase-like protein
MTRWLWMAGVVAAGAAVGAQTGASAMDTLVEAERSFARMSVATSQREAFLANFADDGMWFTPGPEVAKDALRKAPAPAGPPTRTLDWEPSTGDVAASGDLGYTTGPYVSSPKAGEQPPTTGWFFSVWRRRPDAVWQVAADFGISGPSSGPLRPRVFRRADVHGVAPSGRPVSNAAAEELRTADSAFASEATAHGLAAAFSALATTDVLLLRDGIAPIAGRAAALSFTPPGSARLTWRPIRAEASGAGDMGFTYGEYTSAVAGREDQRGFYLHVWKRLANGWRLAVDVAH